MSFNKLNLLNRRFGQHILHTYTPGRLVEVNVAATPWLGIGGTLSLQLHFVRQNVYMSSFCQTSVVECHFPELLKKIQQIQRISAINFLFNHSFKNTSLTSASRLMLQFSFYTLWKYKNTLGFLFSGGGGRGEWGRWGDSKRPLTWNGLKGQNL